MTILTDNLSWVNAEKDLKALLNTYGGVRQFTILLDRDSGIKRGLSFNKLRNNSSEKNTIDDLEDVG